MKRAREDDEDRTTATTLFAQLPLDVRRTLLPWLDARTLHRMAPTSRRWMELCASEREARLAALVERTLASPAERVGAALAWLALAQWATVYLGAAVHDEWLALDRRRGTARYADGGVPALPQAEGEHGPPAPPMDIESASPRSRCDHREWAVLNWTAADYPLAKRTKFGEDDDGLRGWYRARASRPCVHRTLADALAVRACLRPLMVAVTSHRRSDAVFHDRRPLEECLRMGDQAQEFAGEVGLMSAFLAACGVATDRTASNYWVFPLGKNFHWLDSAAVSPNRAAELSVALFSARLAALSAALPDEPMRACVRWLYDRGARRCGGDA